MKYGVLVALMLATMVLSGCGNIDWTFGLGNISSSVAADMPGNVTVDVPNNLKLKNELKLKDISPLEFTTNEGQSYQALKKFVTVGLNLSLSIDIVLSNISKNAALFSQNIGNTIDFGGGKWLLYNTNSTAGTFIFYGESKDFTNLYIDWTKENSKFKGKAVYRSLNAADEYKNIFIKYNFSLANPVMDVVLDAREGVAQVEKLRLKVVQQSAGRVNIFAKIVTTNNITNNLKTWEIYGYGGDDVGGGVIATGYRFYDSINGYPVEPSMVGFSFREYFNAAGATLYRWAMVSAKIPSIGDTNIVLDDFTTNTVSTDVQNSLTSTTNDVEVMTNYTYSEPAL